MLLEGWVGQLVSADFGFGVVWMSWLCGLI